jgi:hypothetical protein
MRLVLIPIVLGLAAPALAYEDSPAAETAVEEPSDEAPRTSAPPPIDYPGILAVGPRTSLYVDYTYERTNDLSTFWWVKGRGVNLRFAFGGTYQRGGLRLAAEVPVQYTQLAIDSLMELPPIEADRTKAAISLGDIITRGAYFWELPIDNARTHAGIGMRVRLPTHTTKYQFGLVDGSTLEFGFPYYLHLAPALLLATSYGPLFFVVNQGALAMLASDVSIGGIVQRIPNVTFWESHVAAGLEATDWMAFSIELLSLVQLNRVDVDTMTNLNDMKAVFLNPGLTLAFREYRLALAGRFGLTGRSSRDFGVITFSGTHALLARLGYMF